MIDLMKRAYETFAIRRGTTECWGWNGYKMKAGYGAITISKGRTWRKTITAHRASYMIHRGGIPVGLSVEHLCHNRECTNPAHLNVTTPALNNQRSRLAGRMRRKIPVRDTAMILQRYADGETLGQIAETYGAKRASLHRIVKDAIGLRGHYKKIHPDELPKIFERRKNGETFVSIAKSYGCSAAAVGWIYRKHHQSLA